MKVVYVHTTRWISNSPSVTFVTYGALGFAQSGVETHLIVIRESTEETDQIFRDVFDTPRPPNLFVHRLPAPSHWSFFRNAIRVIKGLGHDEVIVVTRSLSLLPHLVVLGRSRPIKTLYESHNFFMDLKARDDIRKHQKLKKSALERLFIKRTHGLICLQEAQKELYRPRLPDAFPIGVFRPGIHRFYPREEDPVKNALAYIGSLDEHKGVEIIFRLARKLGPGGYIKVIGGKREGEVDRLRERCRRENLHDKIRFTGWVHKRDLHRELSDIRWGLVPLKKTFFNAYLTAPMKLFDFYAHGIPVLATDLPTLRELVDAGRTGFLVDWNDLDGVIARIDMDDAAYGGHARAVRVHAERYSWKERGRGIIEFAKGC